jgi:hypothetical protein
VVAGSLKKILKKSINHMSNTWLDFEGLNIFIFIPEIKNEFQVLSQIRKQIFDITSKKQRERVILALEIAINIFTKINPWSHDCTWSNYSIGNEWMNVLKQGMCQLLLLATTKILLIAHEHWNYHNQWLLWKRDKKKLIHVQFSICTRA